MYFMLCKRLCIIQIHNMMRLQLLIDKQTSHTLSSTNTHTCQQDLLLLSSALAQSSNNLSCTSGTQWVTKSNSTTTRVHLLVWQFQGVFAVDSHGCESLVDLNDVTVIDGDVVLAQKLGDGD